MEFIEPDQNIYFVKNIESMFEGGFYAISCTGVRHLCTQPGLPPVCFDS
jgi:hypothetical protein